MRSKISSRQHPWLLLALAVVLGLAWAKWGPMEPLFTAPLSTVVLDRNGELLGATVAADGQWRMAPGAGIPERFKRCLLEFEDRHFEDHPGVHLPSLLRAWQQNHKAGRTISGGSTITMQLARMSGSVGERTYLRKIGEMLKAWRIELRTKKSDILGMYAANAPFGANVVGLEAAAWRWFGRPPKDLSWAESAMLAVLPNSPARLHPGRGREGLKAKRDRLLARLHATGALDELEYSLALEEPLPDAPLDLPRRAPHLLTTLRSSGKAGTSIHTSLNGQLQDRVSAMAHRYAALLRANEVHNAAVLVLDVGSGEVLAYVGNLATASLSHAPEVDIVHARRSTGSLLKPFLYAAMLQEGELMPDQLVADLPTHYEGFAPRNFDQRFDGAVPASQALSRSLNVPAVRALREHGIDRTIRLLREMGLHHVDRSADHYGLSLILGGSESTLWELTGAYASLARIVLRYSGPGSVDGSVVHPPTIQTGPVDRSAHLALPISPAAAYHTLLALQQLNRPETQEGWQYFGGEPISWKTGTSFGHRDAWAIGVTDRYAVGVWTGNASGEGRPALTGTLVAAPLLFEIFGILPNGRGFDPPYDAMSRIAVCRHSGHRASPDCTPVDTLWTITEGLRTGPCPYHQLVLLDATGSFRSTPGPDAVATPWFVLPPAMEYYYKAGHPQYRSLPSWPADMVHWESSGHMEMIYPEKGALIHIPVQLDGLHGRVVLQAAHREPAARIHWDINGVHSGTTREKHELPIDLPEGRHRLTLTDHRGRTLTTSFGVERGKLPSN